MAKKISEGGTKGFLMWVRANQPRLYWDFAKVYRAPQSGLGDVAAGIIDPAASANTAATSPTWANTLKDLFATAAQGYLSIEQLRAQRKLMDLQLQRAQQGLPPLDLNPADYALQPTVRAGLAPDTQKLVMWGGIGLLALLALGVIRPRRG